MLAREIDVLNAQLAKRCHLTSLLHTVLVGVCPHCELTKSRIPTVNMAVAIAIQRSERSKAVLGQRAIGQRTRIAKQLRTAGDRAVCRVDQETARSDPANSLLLAAVGEIEPYLAGIHANGGNSVSDVQHEGITAATKQCGAEKLVHEAIDREPPNNAL